jgi:Family of unknown function (DUF5989)
VRLLATLGSRLGIAGELLGFFWSHRWWWLTPMLLVLLLFAAVIFLGQAGPIAPFIYTLF